MTFSRLPVEIILNILEHLSWKQRLSFASVEPYTWICSLQLRTTEIYYLQHPINTLRMACSYHIHLSEEPMRLQLLRLIIMYAYAATKYTVPEISSAHTRFTKWFCKEIAKRRQRSTIDICVDFQHQQQWHSMIEQTKANARAIFVGMKPPVDELDIDAFDTPPELKRQRNYQKELAVKAGMCLLRSTTYSSTSTTSTSSRSTDFILPFVIEMMVNKARYYANQMEAFNNDLLSPTTHLDFQSASTLTESLAKHFMESILFFESWWFLITGFDIFIHNNQSIDDCADCTLSTFHEQVVARISEKGQQGSNRHYELSILIGHVELLVVAGIFGTTDKLDKHAFLGSSVKNLPIHLQRPTTASRILVRRESARVTRSNRLLRQYAKISSKHPWGYYSYTYASKHLYPVNPLHFADHPATSNIRSTVHQLVSHFLLFAATRTATKVQLESLIPLALADPKVNQLVKDKKTHTFPSLANAISDANTIPKNTKSVMDALSFLHAQAIRSDTRNNLAPVMKVVGKLCIKVMDDGFSNKLKAVNGAAVKQFNRDYLQ